MRDFTSTEPVQYEGRTYLIGSIPRAVWRRHALEAAEVIRQATRRAILRAREDLGREPTEDEVKPYRILDPDYAEQMEAGQVEAVRWALRGVEPAPEGGVPIEEVEHHGRSWRAVRADFVWALAEDEGLLGRLYTATAEKNTVTEDARKNSPPPSPSARGDGGATSA